MKVLIYTLIYLLLLGFLSLWQGTLSLIKVSEKRKKVPQLVTIQFLIGFLLCGYTLLLHAEIHSYFTNQYVMYGVLLIWCTYSFIIVHRLCKGFGVKKEKQLARRLKPLTTLFQILCTPLTFFVRIPVLNESEEVTEEDIREMIQTSQESGHIEEPQKELFDNVFEFDDTSVEEICTHRSEVVCLYLEDDMNQWKQVIHDNRHTFYPICQEDEDDVVGVLDTRDYFRMDAQNQDYILAHAVDKPLFVLENTKADDCFMEMKKRKYYFAIVIDEYGGMSGIVTLHDIVETILGEMYEEEDEEEPEEIQKLDQNSFRIYGSASLEDVQKELNIPLPVQDYDTFGGYLLSSYGSVPDDGEQFDIHFDHMDVTVKEMKNHRVMETIVNVIQHEEENKDETVAGSD